MEESKRHVRLGVFVVTSVGILVAALLLLGGRNWFQPTFTFETYFDKSIAGLELGAPVRFRGVPLGHVSEILTSAATYERDVPLDRRREYIVVRVKVNASAREATQMKEDAVTLGKKGLRAQTQLAGLTGQQYLSLDFLDPRKAPPLAFEWKPKYTYLPSAPSSAGQILAEVQAFLANLNRMDISALSRNLNALVIDVDAKLTELPVADLSASARDVLGKADATLARIDALVGDPALQQTFANAAAISGRLRKVADDGDLDSMIKEMNDAAQRLDVLLGDNQYDVRAIVQDLRTAADNLRVVSETIKRYPAGALIGGPPEKIRFPANSQ
jgi:phospholipid/cholesterol/gamma-HCH transport system substrate-binding protein/paraquat-inducible protein B